MHDDYKQLKTELEALKQRNARVESDKAWERSPVRIGLIALITYAVASAVLYMIGVCNYLSGATIPTIGYLLSTQSLPIVKRWWLNGTGRSSRRPLK